MWMKHLPQPEGPALFNRAVMRNGSEEDPMNIDWILEAHKHAHEIMDIREEIHAFPELGNQEFKTAGLIEERLHSYGIPTRRLLGTAVIGELHGCKPADAMDASVPEESAGCSSIQSGRIVALRADMDALPIHEQTDWAFASGNEGVMHACGHDVHMAAALGAARLLSKHADLLRGTVRFIFQPDEEGNGGAERLVKEHVLDGVSAVFGAHVSPNLPLGTIGIRYGKFYAASDVIRVKVHGRSCHGAEPEKGIDALHAAARMVTALKKLPLEFFPEHSVLTIGTFRSGTAENILPGEAEFQGIIRTLGPDTRAKMKACLLETIQQIEAETDVTAELFIRESYPGVVNTDSETACAEGAALRLFGPEHVCRIAEPTMTTEDFGYYVEAAGGSFYHIGVGGDYPLHNEHFLPPDDAPVIGAALHAAVLFSRLQA